jgi:hypothetical protein
MTVVARLRRPPHRGRVPPQSVVSVTSRGSIAPSRAPSLDRKEAVLCVIPSFEMTAPSRSASGAVDSASGARSTTGAVSLASAPALVTRRARTFTDPEQSEDWRRHKGRDQRQRQNDLHGDGTTSRARRLRIKIGNGRARNRCCVRRIAGAGRRRENSRSGRRTVTHDTPRAHVPMKRRSFRLAPGRATSLGDDEAPSRDHRVVPPLPGGARHESRASGLGGRDASNRGLPSADRKQCKRHSKQVKGRSTLDASFSSPKLLLQKFDAVRTANLLKSYRCASPRHHGLDRRVRRQNVRTAASSKPRSASACTRRMEIGGLSS